MKERTWSQRLDVFEGSEVEWKVVGCRVWAYMMHAETWDGGDAQVDRGGGDVNLLGVAVAGTA